MRTSGRAFLRRFRSQASSSSRDNSAAVMAHHSRSPYASVAVAPAERRSAGRGGTSAAIPMRRRPPRLGSPPGPPLRGDPSNQSVSPGGEPIGPRRDWGEWRQTTVPVCPGNMARHRQGPIVPGQSRTAHRRNPDSGPAARRCSRTRPSWRAKPLGRAAAPSRGRYGPGRTPGPVAHQH
jgi:hypothetical protein